MNLTIQLDLNYLINVPKDALVSTYVFAPSMATAEV